MVRWCPRYVLALVLQAGAAPAWGQALVSPREVVLYIHSDMKSTAFVDLVICALERVLVAPVLARKIDLPLGAELRASPTQFDVGKVASQFIPAIAENADARTFSYLLEPYDLKGEPYRFVFATSFGNETTRYHVGIISTARLDTGDPLVPHQEGAEQTALRAYKLVLKSIARLSGYGSSDGCILAFPNSLAQLDQKPAQFCPADRAALVEAGVLKAVERGTCGPVALRKGTRAHAEASFALRIAGK
jgi:predicted Zn-dependent protease